MEQVDSNEEECVTELHNIVTDGLRFCPWSMTLAMTLTFQSLAGHSTKMTQNYQLDGDSEANNNVDSGSDVDVSQTCSHCFTCVSTWALIACVSVVLPFLQLEVWNSTGSLPARSNECGARKQPGVCGVS